MGIGYGVLGPELQRLLLLSRGEIPPPLSTTASTPQASSRLTFPFSQVYGPPPTYQPNLLERAGNVLSGANERLFPLPSGIQGLLSPSDVKGARRQGLLALAATLLQNAGPVVGGPAPSLAQGLGRGLIAGQQAYQGGVGERVNAVLLAQQLQEATRQREKETAAERAIRDIATKYPISEGMSELDVARQAYRRGIAMSAIPGAEKAGASLAGMVASTYPGIYAATHPKPTLGDVRVVDNVLDEKTKKPYIVAYDNDTGREVWRKPMYIKPTVDATGRIERRMDAQNINSVLDDYRNDALSTEKLVTRLRPTVAQENYQKALNKDAAAQISLLYGFVNLMDETAVREGEQTMVRVAGPFLEQVRGILGRYALNESYSIPPTLIKQIYPIMQDRMRAFGDRIETAQQRALQRGRILGIGPEIQSLITPPSKPLRPDNPYR